MEQVKIKNDNKSLKETKRTELIALLFEMGWDTLTRHEKDLLKAFLLDDKTFQEIGSVKSLTSYRQKQIFDTGLKRLVANLRAVNNRLADYAKLQENHAKLQSEHISLKDKLARLSGAGALAKRTVPLENLSEATVKFLHQSVEESDLSARVRNACRSNGVNTIYDLAQLQVFDLMKWRNCGMKTISEIEQYFEDNGLNWRSFSKN